MVSGDRGNIEDRRGSSGRRAAVPVGIGTVIVLGLLSWATGTNFLSLLDEQGSAPSQTVGGEVQSTPQEERKVDFVDAVAADVQTDVRAGARRPLRADDRRAVPRRGRIRLRFRLVGDGPVLLPRRPQGLSRPRILRRADAAIRRTRRFRPGLCHRARDRSSRPASARPRRRTGAATLAARTARRSRSSSRQTVSPASGVTRLRRAAGPAPDISSSNRATPRRRCARRPPSATTGCRRWRPAA